MKSVLLMLALTATTLGFQNGSPPTTAKTPATNARSSSYPDVAKLMYASKATIASKHGHPVANDGLAAVDVERYLIPGIKQMTVVFYGDKAKNILVEFNDLVTDPKVALRRVGLDPGNTKLSPRPGFVEWKGKFKSLPTRHVTVGRVVPNTDKFNRVHVYFEIPGLKRTPKN